jgi:membrane protease YdiL (CAAX protease family)
MVNRTMSSTSSAVSPVNFQHAKARGWLTCLAFSLAIPAVFLSVVKLLSMFVPAGLQGSVPLHYWIAIASLCGAEWLMVLGVWFILKSRGETFRTLGLWRWGTWYAWVLAIGLAVLTISNNVHLLQRFGIPAHSVFLPTGFHLYAAVVIGVTAGFCEEIIFRGYMMTEFARMGYGKVLQVIAPGLFFGLMHMSAIKTGGVAQGLSLMISVAILGMLWGIAYLLGRRSLMPTIAAHFLNDFTGVSWMLFLMTRHAMHQ